MTEAITVYVVRITTATRCHESGFLDGQNNYQKCCSNSARVLIGGAFFSHTSSVKCLIYGTMELHHNLQITS